MRALDDAFILVLYLNTAINVVLKFICNILVGILFNRNAIE